MKKLIILVIFGLLYSCSMTRTTWEGHTKFKPVKRISRAQFKKMEDGKSFYYRKYGKVHKRY